MNGKGGLEQWLFDYQEYGLPLKYHGVPIMKQVMDLWMYQEIIHDTKPDVVIETGTAWGASANWFRNEGPEVITIDIAPRPKDLASDITHLQGDSVSLAPQVEKLLDGRRAMVVLDSAHDAPHVYHELLAYHPLVADDCYLIVEDGYIDYLRWTTRPGPYTAVTWFTEKHPEFTHDPHRTRLSVTFNPESYLRKICKSPRST